MSGSDVTAVCYCIGTKAADGSAATTANASPTSFNPGTSAEQCRQTLAREFAEPYNFCYFYNKKSVLA
jgi:hypothetical protein